MAIKKFNYVIFLLGSLIFDSFALEQLDVQESGKMIKLYPLENEVMIYSQTGEPPERIRTNTRNTRRLSPGDKVSEIFSESPEGSGRLRSLPGGVIVSFTEGVDPESWAVQNNLSLEKKLKPGVYLISSPSGRASLAKANEIAELDGVETVEPNWWTNVESKSGAPKGRLPASLEKSLQNYFQR